MEGQMNQVALIGNVCRDGELKATQQGMSVLRFTIAVNEKRKEGNEYKDHPVFVPCVVFGKRAEGLARYVTKGAKFGVTGKLDISSYEKDGVKKTSVSVICDSVDFAGANAGMQQTAAYPQTEAYTATYMPQAVSTEPVQDDLEDEDIPF